MNCILEIIVDRMKREFNVEANVGKPQVAYRETIRKTVEQEGKYVRQTGGRGQYGHVWIKIEPQEAGTGYEFVNDIVVVLFQENIFLRLIKVFKNKCKMVLLLDILWLMSKLLCLMVLTMMLTLVKWHLKLLVLWLLKKVR